MRKLRGIGGPVNSLMPRGASCNRKVAVPCLRMWKGCCRGRSVTRLLEEVEGDSARRRKESTQHAGVSRVLGG